MSHHLTGRTAIRYAERHPEFDGRLQKYRDPLEGPRSGLSVSQAQSIAREDARLIHLTVPSGKRKRKNPKKPSKRVGKALAAWLKRQNPAMKKARGVRVQRLKGGVIKLSPVK
jgi:hypothetical protein